MNIKHPLRASILAALLAASALPALDVARQPYVSDGTGAGAAVVVRAEPPCVSGPLLAASS
jgi:hypothetical protein